jgi:hypothetical protein
MNPRQLKKAFKQLAATPGGRDALLALLADKDTAEFEEWADQPNGSERLQAIHQAVTDCTDTILGATRALDDDDTCEALNLLALGYASMREHLDLLERLL